MNASTIRVCRPLSSPLNRIHNSIKPAFCCCLHCALPAKSTPYCHDDQGMEISQRAAYPRPGNEAMHDILFAAKNDLRRARGKMFWKPVRSLLGTGQHGLVTLSKVYSWRPTCRSRDQILGTKV